MIVLQITVLLTCHKDIFTRMPYEKRVVQKALELLSMLSEPGIPDSYPESSFQTLSLSELSAPAASAPVPGAVQQSTTAPDSSTPASAPPATAAARHFNVRLQVRYDVFIS